jgi:hypothetical protein
MRGGKEQGNIGLFVKRENVPPAFRESPLSVPL